MRTKTVTLYKIDELGRHAFERAHREYCDGLLGIPWEKEGFESLKALIEAAGLTLKDWSLGAYNRGNFISVKFSNEDAANLKGVRAFAWIENNLLGPLRAPWGLPKLTRGDELPKDYYRDGLKAKRGPVKRWTRPGFVKDCPFTGMFFDEDLLFALREALRQGDTLREAFEGLEHDFAIMLEQEDEYQHTTEAFKETAQANEYEYLADGTRA